MRKKWAGQVFIAVAAAIPILVVLGMSIPWAQVKPAGKPPAQQPCNNNGVCEYGETTSGSTTQWCPDCYLKTYGPLNMIPDPGKQIAARGNSDHLFSGGRVFQFVNTGVDGSGIGTYKDMWASNNLGEFEYNNVAIGDADNDLQKEIIATPSYFAYRTGSGKNAADYFFKKIYLFEHGSDGSPSWISPNFDVSIGVVRDSLISDIDGDGQNEIVLLDGSGGKYQIEIYRIVQNGSSYVFDTNCVWRSPTYNSTIYTLNAGDTDNDGKDEIIIGVFEVGGPIIWDYNYGVWSSTAAVPLPIAYWRKLTKGYSLKIDWVKARNVDNSPGNELIAGGNNNRLMVWRYNPATSGYDWIFAGEDLGGFTQGGDAGDLDGDGNNEIAIGATAGGGTLQTGTIYLYRYEGGTFVKKPQMLAIGDIYPFDIGDLDGDGKGEIAGWISGGVSIIEFVSGAFYKAFNCVWGSAADID